jgi:lysozyme
VSSSPALLRKVGIAAGIVLLSLSLPAFLYLTGRWIPNEPDDLAYPIRGIDVSAHQGRIDWAAVSKSGIHFVYLKATEGGDFQDAAFAQNLQAAHDAGLACGAYHFFSLKTAGLVQAQNFIKTAPAALLDLPPAIDLEFWGNTAERPSPDSFQKELRDFVAAIQTAYHREPIIYTSADFADIYLKDFPINHFWVRDTFFMPTVDGTATWSFWQFTEKGTVPGIESQIDMDVFNGSADRFDALVHVSEP